MKTGIETEVNISLDKILSNAYFYLLNLDKLGNFIINLSKDSRKVLLQIAEDKIKITTNPTEYNIFYNIIVIIHNL